MASLRGVSAWPKRKITVLEEVKMGAASPDPSAWKKSSWSGGHGNCVEVADSEADIHVRDSKNPENGVLMFQPAVWAHFIHAVKSQGLDRP
jgi:hypothetical protein